MPAPNVDEIIGSASEHMRFLSLDGGAVDCACVTFARTLEDTRQQQYCVCSGDPVTWSTP